MRSCLARLVSAEVRRLTDERDKARQTRQTALRAALRWHQAAQLWQAAATAATARARGTHE